MNTTDPDALEEQEQAGLDRRAADMLVLSHHHLVELGAALGQAVKSLTRPDQSPDDVRNAHEALRSRRRDHLDRHMRSVRRELADVMRFIDEAETILVGE